MGRTCEDCGIKMPKFTPRRRREDGALVCNGCHPDGKGRPSMPIGLHGSLVIEPNGDEWIRGETILELRTASLDRPLIVVAHDGGEGEVIYHCPFCGGGNVVRNSDNSTECGFCNTTFTVQVQPEFPNMPQTINGQPADIPGMPGAPGTPSDGAAPGDQQQAPATPNAFQPPDAPAAAFEPPDQAAPLPKAAARMYLTDRGVLNEDAYIRHLALRFADDPELTLRQVFAAAKRKESVK